MLQERVNIGIETVEITFDEQNTIGFDDNIYIYICNVDEKEI